MVESPIIRIVQRYLQAVAAQSVPIVCGILFGSYARNEGIHQWSDIDVLVISPRYDEAYSRADLTLLWNIAARTEAVSSQYPLAHTVGTPTMQVLSSKLLAAKGWWYRYIVIRSNLCKQ